MNLITRKSVNQNQDDTTRQNIYIKLVLFILIVGLYYLESTLLPRTIILITGLGIVFSFLVSLKNVKTSKISFILSSGLILSILIGYLYYSILEPNFRIISIESPPPNHKFPVSRFTPNASELQASIILSIC